MPRVIIDRVSSASGVSGIEVDAVISEKHVEGVELTKHPIEEGSNPTDHARVLPAKYQLEGFVTNTPLSQTKRNARGVIDDASSSGAPGAVGYAQQAIAALRKLKDDRRAVTVDSTMRTYTNMVLVSLEVPRDGRMTDAFRFSATFEEVRFVASEVARTNVQFRPKRKPVKKVDQSKKPAASADSLRSSLLKKLADSTGLTTAGSGVTP